jgi:hypothetical protein
MNGSQGNAVKTFQSQVIFYKNEPDKFVNNWVERLLATSRQAMVG